MGGDERPGTGGQEADLGAYCREVEAHLARANGGHLIRIAGPAFELVRSWARSGVPLSVVCHGIDLKAERHRAGRSVRPLRLEFCDVDVRAAFEQWRRAVGVSGADPGPAASKSSEPVDRSPRRRPSVARHLDRIADRLGRLVGQLDRSEAFRDVMGDVLQEVTRLRETSTGRGADRDRVAARLSELDADLMASARQEAGEGLWGQLLEEAAGELAGYRGRLAPEAWDRSLTLSAASRLRQRFLLPTLDLE